MLWLTCLQVGPVVKKKDINNAAYLKQHPIVKSENHEPSKLYQQLKVTNIPITDDHELMQWDLIVQGMLDWAGTLLDPFGTNEHPDLLDTVQDLWDNCLPERVEDVHDNPTVKKVVCLTDTLTVSLSCQLMTSFWGHRPSQWLAKFNWKEGHHSNYQLHQEQWCAQKGIRSSCKVCEGEVALSNWAT